MCPLILFSILYPTVAGCSHERAADVERALARYGSDSAAAREEARSEILVLGDAAVPHLRDILENRDGDHTNALQALMHVGSEDAFNVLLSALGGRTRLRPSNAARLLVAFLKQNNWPPEGARRVEGAIGAAMRYIENSEDARGAIDVALALGIAESAPILRKLTQNSDYSIRYRASEALRALIGEAIVIETPVERFLAVDLQTDLLELVMTKRLVGSTTWLARLSSSPSEQTVIVATRRHERRRQTDVILLDVGANELGAFSIPGSIGQFVVLPRLPPRGSIWLVACAAPRRGARQASAIAFDRKGSEIWRLSAPSGSFRSVTWKYDLEGQPQHLIFGYSGQTARGYLAVGLDGRELWRTNASPSWSLIAHPCVPARLLKSDAGMGVAYLMDANGSTLARTAFPINGLRVIDVSPGRLRPASGGRVRTGQFRG